MIYQYLKLIRVHHYIKNFLVFIPLFFSGSLLDVEKFQQAILGFVCFCLISSIVYIINDYRDINKDQLHPKKKTRPLASGRIKPISAFFLMILFVIIVSFISIKLMQLSGIVYLLLYIVLNLAYSFGLKNKPIIDVLILASGFVLRILYGGSITDIEISKWLYLVVTTGSLYMGLGKRRNELKREKNTRNVLKYYNIPFLDKNMYVCVALTNVFYALWTIEMPNGINMIWTVPVFITILLFYSLDTEGDSDGDPVNVLLNDKVLIVIVFSYIIYIFSNIYLGGLNERI